MHCTTCSQHITAYTLGQLDEGRRDAIVAHLDDCDACYAEYIHQRDLDRYLTDDLSLLGRPSADKKDELWREIEPQIMQPLGRPSVFVPYRQMIALAVAVTCILPWAMTKTGASNDYQQSVTIPAAVAQVQSTPGAIYTDISRQSVLISQPTEDVVSPVATTTPAVAPVPKQTNP